MKAGALFYFFIIKLLLVFFFQPGPFGLFGEALIKYDGLMNHIDIAYP